MTKALTAALEKPHLYDSEEYAKLRKQAYQLRKLRQKLINDQKAYRGFGYTYEPINYESVSKICDGDPTSGTDDGVHCESEQPSESGESERSGTTEVLHQA